MSTHLLGEGTEGMSDNAKKIVAILGHTGKISDIINNQPELVPHLDEYISWRDRTLESVEHKTSTPQTAHSIASTLKKLQ